MKRALTLAFVPLIISCQMKGGNAEREPLKVERDFATAVLSNPRNRQISYWRLGDC